MWVIVKHETVWIKHKPTNEMVIQIEHGCHHSIEAAVTLCDDLYEQWLDCSQLISVVPFQCIALAYEHVFDKPMSNDYTVFFAKEE